MPKRKLSNRTPVKNPKSQLPLPFRNGINPSYIWLPEGRWENVLHFLLLQFPNVSEATWLQRIEKKEVVDGNGQFLQANSPVFRGMCIFYYREVENEVPIPFKEIILFQDEHLVVVDKPHFLPVTPGGAFLQETLLTRLKKTLSLEQITPLHRLDRETAGVIIFSCKKNTRGAYQALFQQRQIEKIYHAVAPHLADLQFPICWKSRLEESEQFFVMQETEGEANSETVIEILERRGNNNLYQLRPITGKKHQLRLHLASLGAPIINDRFYPNALPVQNNDFSAPLQLLAKSIGFIDPFSGEKRIFYSGQAL